jgi:hypothetical protein
MVLTMLNGYPDFIGYRQAFAGYGTGPTSYNATTGDVVTLSNNRRFIDVLWGGVQSLSGTYTVFARPSGTGERQTWSLHWFTTSNMTEVTTASNTNLSGETVQIGGYCGQF